MNMKRLFIVGLCLLLAGLWGCGRTTSEETTEALTKIDPSEFALYTDAIEAYYKRFNEDNSYYIPNYYSLYDIDGNGTKELLISDDGVNPCEIYAIQDGAAVLQKEFRSYCDGITNPSSFYKNGTIRQDSAMDPYIYYYRFEDGELKLQTALFNHFPRISRIVDWGDTSRAITLIEFWLVQKRFEGGGPAVKAASLDWKPFAEYGR